MAVRPEVIRYLRTHCGKFPDEALRGQLLADGVRQDEVDNAFAIINLGRPASHITDRGRAPQPVEPAPPEGDWKKNALLFLGGVLCFMVVAVVGLVIHRFNSPDTRRWLEDLQSQAAALSRPAPAQRQSAGSRTTAEDMFSNHARMAQQSLLGKKTQDAVRYADLALESWKKDPHGLDNKKAILGIRARAHETLGHDPQALADYQSIAQMGPGETEALLGRGRIFLAREDFQSAVQEADKIIAQAPTAPEGYALAAAVFAQWGRPRDALQNFSRAIDTFPAEEPTGERASFLANLHFNRGVLLANGRRLPLALKDLSQAIRFAPQVTSYYRARAQVRRGMGLRQLADQDEQEAESIGADGASDAPRLGLGPTLLNRGPSAF